MPRSRANGPGTRFVIWTQGCARRCPGCFNPTTHAHEPHQLISVDEMFDKIMADSTTIEGISISGGEPLEQADAIFKLLTRIRQETSLSTLFFTGYTYDEITANPVHSAILPLIDVLIAGPYDETQRQSSSLLGSKNQQIYLLTNRYTRTQLEYVPPTEVHITPDGQIIISGINPQHLNSE
jgi:anaerobic ribonucleoside-triphosphate reductase activating protein